MTSSDTRRPKGAGPHAVNPQAHPDFQAGFAAFGRGDPAAAETAFLKAAAAFPDYGPVHGNLGVILRRLEREDAAEARFRLALALDPAMADIWSNYGVLLREAKGRDEAATAAALQRALRLNPDHPAALCNLGNLRLDQAVYAEAATLYQATLKLRPDLAEAHKNLGFARLVLGDLREGFAEYEWRLQAEDILDIKGPMPWPRWRGEDLRGKTLLAVTEQGYGDVLHFVRYGRLIERMGGKMALTCQGPLVPLMQRADGVAHVVATGSKPPPVDYWAPLLSLPWHFGTGLNSIPLEIPYVHADPALTAAWGEQLPAAGGPLRVGLVWAGNPKHKNDHNRSLPLALLDGLLRQPGVHFVSLQKDMRPGDEEGMAQYPNLSPLGHRIHTFDDTAAVLQHLDLVITVDTSVVHLAGAMGKPVWMLIPLVPDWRWMVGRTDSPWYPGLRIYRQQRAGDWAAVMTEVTTHLQAVLAGRRPVIV
jgi:Tfp pilus assembly protein PilF